MGEPVDSPKIPTVTSNTDLYGTNSTRLVTWHKILLFLLLSPRSDLRLCIDLHVGISETCTVLDALPSLLSRVYFYILSKLAALI